MQNVPGDDADMQQHLQTVANLNTYSAQLRAKQSAEPSAAPSMTSAVMSRGPQVLGYGLPPTVGIPYISGGFPHSGPGGDGEGGELPLSTVPRTGAGWEGQASGGAFEGGAGQGRSAQRFGLSDARNGNGWLPAPGYDPRGASAAIIPPQQNPYQSSHVHSASCCHGPEHGSGQWGHSQGIVPYADPAAINGSSFPHQEHSRDGKPQISLDDSRRLALLPWGDAAFPPLYMTAIGALIWSQFLPLWALIPIMLALFIAGVVLVVIKGAAMSGVNAPHKSSTHSQKVAFFKDAIVCSDKTAKSNLWDKPCGIRKRLDEFV